MSTYRVYMSCTISKCVEVEADDKDASENAAYASPDAPGAVMFLDHTYPDMSDWEVASFDDIVEVSS